MQKMETKDIIERVVELLKPDLDSTVSNLETKDIDYFIAHITLDLTRSIQHWEHKKKGL